MTQKQSSSPRSIIALGILVSLCGFFFLLFSFLGTWQVQRLGWKENLIARVNERIDHAPVPAPLKAQWPTMNVDNSDYTPVTIQGTFLNDKEVLITTLANDDSGYWLMVPLKTDDGSLIFINRGFIPMDRQSRGARRGGEIDGPTTVNGILRMSEGVGYWPRKNSPAENRWYYRNIPQMTEKLKLQGNVAPYFIDADKTPNFGGVPVGGLTVVSFTNNHLVYAITWYLLAAGMVAAFIFLLLSERNRRYEKYDTH